MKFKGLIRKFYKNVTSYLLIYRDNEYYSNFTVLLFRRTHNIPAEILKWTKFSNAVLQV